MDEATRIRLTANDRPRPNFYRPAITRTYGSVTHADKFGTDIALRSRKPPPVEEYNAWLERPGQNSRRFGLGHGGPVKAGFRLRRIVIMRREGCSWKECGEALGIRANLAREWVEFLPRELAV